MLSCIVHVFEDKRSAIVMVVSWMFIVVMLTLEFGLHNSAFMHVGPSRNTLFMMVPIDTWYKWRIVAVISFLSTGMNVFLGDSLEPWITNVIQDPKCRTIPYSKFTCQVIVLLWSLYGSVMSTLYMFIALTQVDFLCIRIVAEVFVMLFTNHRFLRNKVHHRDSQPLPFDSIDDISEDMLQPPDENKV